MANDIQITSVTKGLRIPVVVENKPAEPIPVAAPNTLPVEVKNNPEIHGAVHLSAPGFLVVGRNYRMYDLQIGGGVHLVKLLSSEFFPWLRVQDPTMSLNEPLSSFWLNSALVARIDEA